MRYNECVRILGIETSCDETAVCLIEGTGVFGADFSFKILGNSLASQAALHAQYGGVFPNLAKREHAKALVPMLSAALQLPESERTVLAELPRTLLGKILEREPELLELLVPYFETHTKPQVDAIAVTHGPGLEPALWVGINFAKALSSIWNVPIVAVDHMEGHIMLSLTEHSDVLKNPRVSGEMSRFDFPMLSLLISGGHTELILSKSWMQYERIGETRDDAAGEAFDKVARLLDLPYPGGPEISRLAKEAREKDVVPDFKFTRPMLHDKGFDFSFSGLKTAVRTLVEKHRPLSDAMKLMIAREFEDTVADVLVEKTVRAVEEFGVATVLVGGGVSANDHIRLRLAEALAEAGNLSALLMPPKELATDNAIMIALAGYFHAQKGEYIDPAHLTAKGNLRLENRA